MGLKYEPSMVKAGRKLEASNVADTMIMGVRRTAGIHVANSARQPRV